MKKFNNTIIIGIDHGYGNMKTANCCFPTGLIAYNCEPLFTKELLAYNGKYYLIGEEHKEYISDKSLDEDFLCAYACRYRKRTEHGKYYRS